VHRALLRTTATLRPVDISLVYNETLSFVALRSSTCGRKHRQCTSHTRGRLHRPKRNHNSTKTLGTQEPLGSDDWTILIAAILTIVLNALSIAGVKHGKGRHVCFLDADSIAEIGRYSLINQIVLFWALFFIKISVCLLILRVKSTATLRWISGIAVGMMVSSTVVACAALLAECSPVSAYWNRSSGQCRPPTFRIYSIWVQAGTFALE
jgi:hypothetical protein